ncbi:chromate resistance protein [Sorangium sp. wiwo2]|uniref:Chromate resistance protein n=1 Tax=Sorangium atrum TaxID=2995308 RepID=A0ABT5CJW4_9BACT|nr:chromate resistance protein ChrB domain-containing protein [Sorangium aterium]MDC0685371.1 chromate resistance protein [Sorangium aterium]
MLAAEVRGRTWVTRKNIHVDRIASAWIIRRFLDPEACFKFVSGKGYSPEPGELRFDMFEAEFTHEGDRCTFEVLLNPPPNESRLNSAASRKTIRRDRRRGAAFAVCVC